MKGDQTTTSTNATDTTSDLLSYPTVGDQVGVEQEVAAVPMQQVGFVPQKDLDVKSKPIQAVATDAEKNRAKLEALIKKQAVTKTPIPTVAPEAQSTQIEPTPVVAPVAQPVPEQHVVPQAEPVQPAPEAAQAPTPEPQQVTTVEQVPTQTPSIPPPVEKAQPKPVPVIDTPEVAQTPVAEPAPTPTDAELRGQQLAQLAQGKTTAVEQTAVAPTVGATPEVTATPQSPPVTAMPEQIEGELEVAPIVGVQPYAPTATPSLVPQPTPESHELPTHPFAEVEQEPTPAPATTTSTSALEARIAALEQKIDTLIAITSKWV